MERLRSRPSRPEREAEALAGQALLGAGPRRVPVTRARRPGAVAVLRELPAAAGSMVGATGRPLRPALAADLGRRFGHDFSRVRIHADSRAEQTCRRMGAEALSIGSHVVLGPRARDASTGHGRRLLAHELAHVTQPGPPAVRLYRSAKAFNFGVADDAHLKEGSFNLAKDKSTKPWIASVKVAFASKASAADGGFWKGSATATYHDNPAKEADLSFSIAGGSKALGISDAGTFTVHRIEGEGYNSGSYSGTAGVDFDPADREGPSKRYTKPDASGFRSSNMSFAVFYNGGEALHAGPLDVSSHGCVHVDWGSMDTMKRLNYHSVIDLTKVSVSYPKKP